MLLTEGPNRMLLKAEVLRSDILPQAGTRKDATIAAQHRRLEYWKGVATKEEQACEKEQACRRCQSVANEKDTTIDASHNVSLLPSVTY